MSIDGSGVVTSLFKHLNPKTISILIYTYDINNFIVEFNDKDMNEYYFLKLYDSVMVNGKS